VKRSLPALEFTYRQPVVSSDARDIDAASLENAPRGADGWRDEWVDLDGEGTPGLLTRHDHAWYYKRNLSPVAASPPSGLSDSKVLLAPIEQVAMLPLLRDGRARAELLDLAADGQLDAVCLRGPTPGFFARSTTGTWNTFQAFTAVPTVDWNDRNLRFVDLSGDGSADILITEDDALSVQMSLGEEGFAPAERIGHALDERHGPRVVFADGTESVHLADMSGDGLADLVRVRNGEVCYWPNLGYGRFGAKVSMDNAPWFDEPDLFDQRRVHLADVDGSGVSDVIYVGADGVRMYFNRSGNAFGEPLRLDGVPHIDDFTTVATSDLFGNGTACLMWSSDLPGVAGRAIRYVDLMGGIKPHLLTGAVNNLGAESRWFYAPSTRFYLDDKLAGRPWITRLPFPVQVVERIETIDRISRNRFTTRYAYHHGYYDGTEREFRGFALVEQFDTEHLETLNASAALPGQTNVDAASHVPPVVTKTWFHTGAFLEGGDISRQLAREYFGAPPGNVPAQPPEALERDLLDDTVLPPDLTAAEMRDACRALKGLMLRQEVYALDASDLSSQPYSITEQNAAIRRLQPAADGCPAVFFTHVREAITAHAERTPDDARVTHNLTLAVDDVGNVLRSAAVAYGRRQRDPDLPDRDADVQARMFVTDVDNRVTNAIDEPDAYRARVICDTQTSEMTGLTLAGDARRLTLDGIEQALEDAVEIAYETAPTPSTIERRVIERQRTRFRADDLTGLLPVGDLPSLALPGEEYRLAFTPGLVGGVYGPRVDETMLRERAGYVPLDDAGGWWIPTGRTFLSASEMDAQQELTDARAHFFLPRRSRDPF
jgi:hypothetical protein